MAWPSSNFCSRHRVPERLCIILLGVRATLIFYLRIHSLLISIASDFHHSSPLQSLSVVFHLYRRNLKFPKSCMRCQLRTLLFRLVMGSHILGLDGGRSDPFKIGRRSKRCWRRANGRSCYWRGMKAQPQLQGPPVQKIKRSTLRCGWAGMPSVGGIVFGHQNH